MKRILIVEDSEDMRFLYKRLFRKHKELQLAETDSAEAALEMLPELKPDLIIVDISLPGINGLDLTKKVRQYYPSMKVLIVTGHEEDRYYEEAIKAGADDLVSKKIGKELVLKCLSMIGC